MAEPSEKEPKKEGQESKEGKEGITLTVVNQVTFEFFCIGNIY